MTGMNTYVNSKNYIFTEGGTTIELTCVTSRDATYSNDVSENAIESGYKIGDSVITKPIEITLSQVTSDDFEKWESVYNSLISNRVLCTVQTTEYIYENMILTNCKKTRDNSKLQCKFDLTFKQVIIISSQGIDMPDNYDYLKALCANGNDTEQGTQSNEEIFGNSDSDDNSENSNSNSNSEIEENTEKSLLAGYFDTFKSGISSLL